MSAPSPDTLDRADREAAQWMARLQQPVVSQADLKALRVWRSEPQNDQALLRQQALWREAARLRRDPEVRAAALAAAARGHVVRSPWTPWAAVASSLAVGIVAVLILAPPGQTYVTARAQRMQVRLADGSLIDLDADSRLRVRLRERSREINLERGQALFEVAHDPGRPFTVRVGVASMTALGTRFDVRRLDEGARIALLQGRLAVQDARAGRRWTLEAGQQVSTSGRQGAGPAAPHALDADLVLGWTRGSLVFRDTPLKDAIAEANRYAATPIVLVNAPGLNAVKVDGVFQAGDPRAFALALTTLYGLRLDEGPQGRLVLAPAANAASGSAAE